MRFVYEKIEVSHQRSFITRKLEMDPHSDKIHSHKNYELNLITSGAGRRIVGNHISGYSEGDLVLLGPDISHCWEVTEHNGDRKPECIVTHFSEDIIHSGFFYIPELEGVVRLLKNADRGLLFRGPETKNVVGILHRMVNLKGLECYIELLKVFYLLLQVTNREILALPDSLPNAIAKKDKDKIDKIHEYVFQHISEGINLSEAAEKVCMEPGSFCRYFKKKTNQTFIGYVRNVRIGMAAKLLAETEKQVSQVAHECGYNSLAHFNQSFRQIMKQTPSAYRQAFKIKQKTDYPVL